MSLLEYTSITFLSNLTTWLGLPCPPCGSTDPKEWLNTDPTQEFFVRRLYPQDSLVECRSITKFNALFQVDFPWEGVMVV
jgi:hypothetical protein